MAHAAAYCSARHGHLAAPVEEDHDGFPLGRWLAHPAHPRRRPHRPAGCCPDCFGPVVEPAPGRSPGSGPTTPPARTWNTTGRPPAKRGGWKPSARRSDRLHPEQKGLRRRSWDSQTCLGVRLPGREELTCRREERAFQRGLAARHTRHSAREGHLNVPQRHIEKIEGDPVRLGQWLSNLRRRRLRPHPAQAGSTG
ncbi:helicase associated domain-containing protein [Streptomyces noursei]|uniref:helicase associated domain-containing protein n=1 Tax=Streptomyces noursei TaxID=1971 RepID=UPI0021A66CC8|nr:helicase associated domain-containing protein [Streptomyces noursei]UWS76972.1 helicase associated domain-containing protein [Streptomyces noursei]UWS77513.1 helicase associated domain-containing protein [Streptomyces noursei]